MGDRVPIGTVPGLASVLVGEDLLVATLGVAGTITRVFLRHTDYDDGGATDTSIAGTIRNATGGGGSGFAVAIADQTQGQVSTGTLELASGDSVYLRLSSAGNSQNLTGWIEVDAAAQVTTALTTLARVKEFAGVSGSDDDALLNNLISSVSGELQTWLDRQIVSATATDEKRDSAGEIGVSLLHYPVITMTSLEEDGTALVEDTDYEVEVSSGMLYRLSSGKAARWATGRRIIKATYSHGYASVPAALVQAATELVVFDYRASKDGGGRFGLRSKVLDTGGSAEYQTREALFRAQRSRIHPYRRVA